MTTTQNLHLPQWEADDRIMRTDFNEAMASIDAACGGMPKIAAGSYVGNGTYGRNSKTYIYFPFVPTIAFVMVGASGSINNGAYAFFIRESNNCATRNFVSGFPIYTEWREEGRAVTFYNESNSGPQLNDQGLTYYWVAIG